MRKVLLWLVLGLIASSLVTASPNVVLVRLADGFDFPVGKPDAQGYYKARGYRANGHLGDDWNGGGGGNSDLNDPVYSTAHGVVLLARDVHKGWGNCVIVRHAYREGATVKFVDSLYAHMNRITVREGQKVIKGQQVGVIGTNHGMYPAHLHFEIRKNIQIGMNRMQFAQDNSNYFDPTKFIQDHRKLQGGLGAYPTPINTFAYAQDYSSPTDGGGSTKSFSTGSSVDGGINSPRMDLRSQFKLDRYGNRERSDQ